MDLIVETDLGRDPDDFFALCYLHSAGYSIRAILISPGDQDQVAVARGLLKEIGLDIPVGSARHGDQSSSGGVHMAFLRRYGYPLRTPSDGDGSTILSDVLATYPDSSLFVCGPVQNVGRYLEKGGVAPGEVTIQGGFVPYHIHPYDVPQVPAFVGKTTVPTFNLNGDPKGGLRLIQSGARVRMVGKNVCHTIIYDRERHGFVKQVPPTSRAGELFREVMDIYLDGHSEKKFHDPTAAVCMRHPEIGTWIPGTPYRAAGAWGTHMNPEGHQCLVDVNRDALWDRIRSLS